MEKKLINKYSEITLLILIRERMATEQLLEKMPIFLIMKIVCRFHTLQAIRILNQVLLFLRKLLNYRSAILYQLII